MKRMHVSFVKKFPAFLETEG